MLCHFAGLTTQPLYLPQDFFSGGHLRTVPLQSVGSKGPGNVQATSTTCLLSKGTGLHLLCCLFDLILSVDNEGENLTASCINA